MPGAVRTHDDAPRSGTSPDSSAGEVPQAIHDRVGPTIIYIAGYGRSGSTILDMMLGLSARAVGVGEVSRLFESLISGDNCSCGSALRECPFWSAVLSRLSAATPDISVEEAARVTRFIDSRWSGSLRMLPKWKRATAIYARTWDAVNTAIAEIADVRYIVDSSKSTRLTAGRVLALADHCAATPRVIHLVRDPRAVSWSMMRGSNERLRKGEAVRRRGGTLRVLGSWLLANSRAARLSRRFPAVAVRYEDFVRDPASELGRICDALELDLDLTVIGAKVGAGNPIVASHGIAGNRLRMQRATTLRADSEWSGALPVTARVLAMLTWPVARRYGYRLP